jgi:hypothetical protein
MNTKLTLTLEKQVIDQAKKYAADQGKSLSEMVESYFRYITESSPKLNTGRLSPRVEKLRGIMQVDADFDYKEVLNAAKDDKYGI